jgi:hypothetical protein
MESKPVAKLEHLINVLSERAEERVCVGAVQLYDKFDHNHCIAHVEIERVSIAELRKLLAAAKQVVHDA